MSSRLVPLVQAFMRAHDVDPTPLSDAFEVPIGESHRADDPGVVLPLSRTREFLAAVAEAMGRPRLGLEVALWAPRGNYGVVEFAARSAPTLRAALERVIRYQRLVNDIAEFSIGQEVDGTVAVKHRISGDPQCVGTVGNEYTVAFLWRMSQEVCGTSIALSRAGFAHPRPQDVSPLTEHFAPATLRFSGGFNEVAFDPQVLAQPLVTRDDALLPVLDNYAQLLCPQTPEPTTFIARVRNEIQTNLHQDASVNTIASKLHASSRTLQRRLSREFGTTFSEILDQVRQERANELLAREALTLSEIGFLLGYSDQRSFFRAFKRWTGTTPQAFRERAMPPSGAQGQ